MMTGRRGFARKTHPWWVGKVEAVSTARVVGDQGTILTTLICSLSIS